MLMHLLSLHERTADTGVWPFTPRPPPLIHTTGEDRILRPGCSEGGCRESEVVRVGGGRVRL